jgi:hypothetical protein
MKKFQRQNDIDDLLEGYKFAFNILVRMLYDNISQNVSLGLTDDLIINRADFKGIEIHLLPNSCEKIIILKNIKKKNKNVITSKTWEQLSILISQFTKEVIEPIEKLKDYSVLNPKYQLGQIEEMIKACTMNEILVSMQDAKRDIPKGYPVPTLDSSIWDNPRKKEEYLHKVFSGYKYAVSFLWFNLLSEDTFIRNLTKLGETLSWKGFDGYFDIIN